MTDPGANVGFWIATGIIGIYEKFRPPFRAISGLLRRSLFLLHRSAMGYYTVTRIALFRALVSNLEIGPFLYYSTGWQIPHLPGMRIAWPAYF